MALLLLLLLPVLILDEPTAALDSIVEYEVYSKFDELVGTKTAVPISDLRDCAADDLCYNIKYKAELSRRGG